LKKILSFFKSLCFRFRPSSIQSVITLSFTSVMLLAMLIVSISLYHLFSESAEKSAALSTQQIVDQVGLNLNSYIEGMMEISDIIRSSLKSDTYQKDDLPYIL
jgi:two-component system sensor histidine kinase YesM